MYHRRNAIDVGSAAYQLADTAGRASNRVGANGWTILQSALENPPPAALNAINA